MKLKKQDLFMNNALYRFAHSKQVLKPFVKDYGCGWFDGGCLIFARALQLWLGGRLAAIVRKEWLDEQTFDHCVLSLPDPAGQTEPLYVDANGAATGIDLLDYWRDRERMPGPVLEDPVKRIRLISHLEAEPWSTWLAEQLTTRFGKPERRDLLRTLGRTPLQPRKSVRLKQGNHMLDSKIKALRGRFKTLLEEPVYRNPDLRLFSSSNRRDSVPIGRSSRGQTSQQDIGRKHSITKHNVV
jgi:hypothetical protein